jgi:class 3 adenylate cyclase/tetratricopeptide (TPR) repeat protein
MLSAGLSSVDQEISTVTETAEPEQVVAQPTRVLTFVMADVRGYTRFTLEHGDDSAARLVSRFAALTREVAAPRGGELIELRGDEALVIFASTRQALLAAVELQGRFAEESHMDPSVPLRVGIGVDVGEPTAFEGGYRGTALNLAARLCTLAGPGEVLASETVVSLARKLDGISYTEQGYVMLQGFTDPVRITKVASAASLPRDEAEIRGELAADRLGDQSLPIGGFLGALPTGVLVGREKELASVLEPVDVATAGRGQVVLLRGEPGAGKTRLAQEITLKVHNRGFVIAAGRCSEADQTVPYYPFLDVLSTLSRFAPASLRALIPRKWPHLAALLPDQIEVHGARESPGRDDQQRLFHAATHFIATIAALAPVAILIDDLHWADTSSLKLWLHLAHHLRSVPTLLVGTYRDREVARNRPLEGVLRDLQRAELAAPVTVPPLGANSTLAMIRATLGADGLSEDLAQLLHSRTDGNPLFIQQVLRTLVERGDVYWHDGRWDQKVIGELEVPESIRLVIRQRLSRLSEATQMILFQASVLGQAFLFDDLQRMAEVSDDELDLALDEAMSAGLIRENGKDGYAFDHGLTQQALYRELSTRRRQKLHLAAGETIERLPDSKRMRRVSELTWHFLQGANAERALAYALEAGTQAESVFAHAEAEWQYRTAAELARELAYPEKEADALEKLGRMLVRVERVDDGLSALESATRIYRSSGDFEAELLGTAMMASAYELKGSPDDGIARIKLLLEESKERNASPGIAVLHSQFALLNLISGRVSVGLAAAERAVVLARAVGSESGLSLAEERLAWALIFVGHVQEARQVIDRLIPRAETSRNAAALTGLLTNAALIMALEGEFVLGRTYAERAIQIATVAGQDARAAFAKSYLALIHTFLGDLDRAAALFREAIEVLRERAPIWTALDLVLAQFGTLLIVQGEWEEATRVLEESVERAVLGRTNSARLIAQIGLASLDLFGGKPEQAYARLEALPQKIGLYETYGQPVLALAALELGDYVRAESLTESAIAFSRQHHVQTGLVEALLIQGTIYARQGQDGAADCSFAEAATLARSILYPYAEGRVLYEWGRANEKRGELQEASEQLNAALALFQRLGARRLIELTAQALGALAPA